MYCCDNYEYSLHCPEKQKRLTLREMTFVRGQNCKELRPGSVGFPEDEGDFLRGMVEHIERFGEHHAGNAEGVANVR